MESTKFQQAVPFYRGELLPPGSDPKLLIEYDHDGIVKIEFNLNGKWIEFSYPSKSLIAEAESALSEFFEEKLTKRE